MSVVAVGIYLDRVAELRGLKVKAVAKQAGVKPGYVSRIISQDIQSPSAHILRALTEAAGASWEDVGVLLDPRADREMAEVLADVWYAKLVGASKAEQDALRHRLLSAIDSLLERTLDLS